MKVRAEEIKVGWNPLIGGVVQLTGIGYTLQFGIPMLTGKKISKFQSSTPDEDPRLYMEDLLEKQIRNLGIEELYINYMDSQGLYSAVLRIDGTEHRVPPSEGILLCTIVKAPVYFDSELENVRSDVIRVKKSGSNKTR